MSELTLIEETPQDRYYGWKAALPGAKLLFPPANPSGLNILTLVDPKVDMPDIVNQLQLGACTGNATARIFRGDTIRDGIDFGPLSRLQIYYLERKLEGTLTQGDVGAMGHDAFTAAATVGIVPEGDWPYVISTFETPPPAVDLCPVEQRYMLKKPVVAVSNDENSVKAVLSNGQKIAVGFTVYPEFEEVTDGVIPMPDGNEQPIAGHEVVISGYDPTMKGYLICDNSWGNEWGHQGRFYIPIPYILSDNYAGDWRTIVRPAGK